jgi:patatin-related protein
MREAERSEQLRIALAMNGGVSLAIWMGGVSLELSRLARGDATYGQLLDATETSVLVDVISGTSAGGINGAFLGTSLVHGTSMASLRNLWLESASLARLFRDPLWDRRPPSLLKGDDYFLPELRFAFSQLVDPMARSPVESQPMDLTLTGTQLVGVQSKLADDFGTVLADITHRVRFRFQRGPGIDGDSFSSPQLIDELALAARTSASFPGAFEASHIPVGVTEADGNGPDMKEVVRSSMTGSGYVVDGGVLDNKPVETALEAIAEQRIGQRFRRVLLYVVPDPTEMVARLAADELPGMADVVWSSLVTIPRSESVVSELRAMQQENRRAEEAWMARRILGDGLSAPNLAVLSDHLFPIYRSVRIDRSVRYVVEQISLGIARHTGVGLPYSGRRSELIRTLAQVGGDLPWIPSAPPDDSTESSDWAWGGRPVEEGLFIVSNLLAWVDSLTATEGPELDCSDLWERYFAVRSALHGDTKDWQDVGEAVADGGDLASLEAFLRLELTRWARNQIPLKGVRGNTIETTDRRSAIAEFALATAEIITDAAQRARLAIGAGAQSTDSLEDDQMAGLLELLAPEGLSAERVLRNLLRFHVVLSALGRDSERQAQVIELMQVSAATPDPFAEDRPVDIAQKLAGVQLGHFGAFYKQAWRANDWMRGRLDGCTRIVQLLLNPKSLRRVVDSSEEAMRMIRELAGAEEESVLQEMWESRETAILTELGYLDDPDSPLPDSLPETCAALARRIQLDIAAEELVTVATACHADQLEGKGRDSHSARFLNEFKSETTRDPPGVSPITRREAKHLLPWCRIGEERIVPDDVGTDRFASAVATSLALASETVQAPGSRLGPLRGVLAVARAPLVLLYLLVTNTVGGRALGIALTSIALSFGLTIVVLNVFVDGLEAVVPVAWVLLVAALLSLIVRGRIPLVVLGVLTLAAIIATILLSDLGSVLEWLTPVILIVVLFLILGTFRWRRTASDSPKRLWGRPFKIDDELANRLESVTNQFYQEQSASSPERSDDWRRTIDFLRGTKSR